MKFAQIYSRLMATPWFVNEPTLHGIARLLESRINSPGPHSARRAKPSADCEEDPAADPIQPPRTPVLAESPSAIALIPVFGVLGKHLSDMETMCGGCDMDAIREQFDEAMADPAVQSVVLFFDSPGGMAIGCHELFTHMFETKSKPLYAYADVLCGSAAYYLACAADAIFAAPTARVGSIGSMLILCDQSAKNEMEGVKFTILKSGEFKGLGDPSQPLSPAGEKALQAMVDQLGGRFRADVSRARPSIAKETMQGLAYLGEEAATLGLVDEVVLDLPALYSRLVAPAPPAA